MTSSAGMPVLFSTFLTFAAAALAEIAGCFAFWAWLRQGKSILWLAPGVASLMLFAYLLTAGAQRLCRQGLRRLRRHLHRGVTALVVAGRRASTGRMGSGGRCDRYPCCGSHPVRAKRHLTIRSVGQSMLGMFALAVIRQNLDDPALADFPVPAPFNHVLELGLQRGEAANTLVTSASRACVRWHRP